MSERKYSSLSCRASTARRRSVTSMSVPSMTVSGGVALLDAARALQDPDRGAVAAAQADLGAGLRSGLGQTPEKGVARRRIGVEVPEVVSPGLLARGESEHPGERRVAVDDPARTRRAVDAREAALEVVPETRLGGAAGLLDLAQPGHVRGDPGRAEQIAARVADRGGPERERHERAVFAAMSRLVLDVAFSLQDPFEGPQVPCRVAGNHPVRHRTADHLLGRGAVDPARGRVDERPPAEGIRRPDELVRVLDEVAVALFAEPDDRVGSALFDEFIMSRRMGANKPRRRAPPQPAAARNAAGASAAATATAIQRRSPVQRDSATLAPAAMKRTRSTECRVPPYGYRSSTPPAAAKSTGSARSSAAGRPPAREHRDAGDEQEERHDAGRGRRKRVVEERERLPAEKRDDALGSAPEVRLGEPGRPAPPPRARPRAAATGACARGTPRRPREPRTPRPMPRSGAATAAAGRRARRNTRTPPRRTGRPRSG